MHQKYSLYHIKGREDRLKQWMAPYSDLFRGCRRVLDVGCGPGLFLELLRDRGIPSIGLDNDPDMVACCHSKGLDAIVQDARSFSGYRAAFDGIHAGHVIEHMDGETAVKFLKQCAVALKPGGILVVRTPNWENETVRNAGFWLDYSHVRPYPLQLLEQIFIDLGLEIVQKGVEPNGWNDIFIVGRKQFVGARTGDSNARPDNHDKKQIAIIWEGSQFVYHSLALVNRELCISLAQSGKVELSIIPYEQHQFGVEADKERFGVIADRLNKPLSKPADFHIRHQYPPNFKPPDAGYWIVFQPWEYGSMPKEWLHYFRNEIDEVWVYSNYNRACYIQDGVPHDKVQVIPLAVNYSRFRPDAPPLALIGKRTKKKFKFLFVGGTIWRKGIDVLLNAFVQAFSRKDDVCLVIKEMGQNSFYRGQTIDKTIKELQSLPNAPEIIYITEELSEADMAGLYTACSCLVHPYRGEGFGLPVAEAMACGVPVIVTKGGACDDFCTDDTVYWIPAKKIEIRIEMATVNSPWALEPDIAALVTQMHNILSDPVSANSRAKRASEHIRQTLSWEKSREIILSRLTALL